CTFGLRSSVSAIRSRRASSAIAAAARAWVRYEVESCRPASSVSSRNSSPGIVCVVMTPPFQARRRTGSDDRRTPPLLPGGIQRAAGTMRTMRLIRTPSRLYRLLALAEMVTWTLLLLGMLLKYALQVTEVGVRIGGSLHGFVFLSYVVVTVLVAVDQ